MTTAAQATFRWLAVMVSLSGCFVPRDVVVDEHVVGQGVTHKVGDPDELGLYVSEDDRRVTVQLVAKRMCSDERYVIVERTVATKFSLYVAPSFGVDAVSAVVAIVALPVSALVTGIIVAGSSDSTTHERRATDTRSYPCALAGAHQRVTLVQPSGRSMSNETDDKGRAVFDLQGGEPVEGIVTVHADHVRPASYRLGGDASHPVTLQMTKTAAAAARAGDCASVRSVDDQLRSIDPVFRDVVFAHEVAIAGCIDAPSSRAASP